MIESNAPQTTKPQNSDNTPNSEKLRYSAAFNKAVSDGKERIALPDPCGTTTVNKIHIALANFFTALKGIKQYANVYITPTINAVSNITSIISQTASIIGAVLKSLMNRLRDFLIDKIRKGIEALIEMLLPTVAKNIKNTIIQTVIDNIFCAFKDIVGGLVDLVLDFLNELVGKVVNAPFCAAQQFTNALINNVAAIVDKAVGPLLDKINDVLGGITKIVGSVFQALDYILGFEAFLCAKPNCPEIKEFKASAWGGPNQAEIDAFNKFLAPAANASAEGIIGSVDKWAENLEIFKGEDETFGSGRLGDSPQFQLPCDTSAFRCGAPKITFFGGGGAGAVGEAIVDNVGRTIGVDLVFGGSNYSRPPFVSFEDSCEDTFTSGYAIIEDNRDSPNFGQVTSVVITSGAVAPPADGRTEFDDVSDDEIDRGNDYIACLTGFRVLNTGIGYTEEDTITITPDVPNLNASVSMTEFGQIFEIRINDPVCGLETIPEVIINSQTGNSAVIQPIVSFTRVEDFDDASGDPDITINVGDTPIDTLRGRTVLTENLENQGLFSRNVVRVVDCVS